VTLIIGAADYTVTIGGFAMNGITLGTFAAIVLYAFFSGAPSQEDFAIVGDDAEARAEMREHPARP
jgi:xanthine/uracil permease